MKIVHRVGENIGLQEQRELASLGIQVNVGLAIFDIDESHRSWPKVAEWIAAHDSAETVRTEFTSEELDAAAWLGLNSVFQRGYPQPEDDFDSITYDLSNHCSKCGMGKVQKAPFRMKGEPKWGRNGLMLLNWVFDEFFATPEVWRGALRGLGIGARPVLGKRGNELENVVQLVSSDDDVAASLEDCPKKTCPVCGRTKFLDLVRGQFPPLLSEPRGHLVRTADFFGSGAAAHRAVLISRDCYRALQANKVRGGAFKPVAR